MWNISILLGENDVTIDSREKEKLSPLTIQLVECITMAPGTASAVGRDGKSRESLGKR